MPKEKLEIVTLNDVLQYFAENNAATIGSQDLIQDTFIFAPGNEDKIQEILDKMWSPTNLLIWGTRGVGKTLFLKKTYYDLLDEKNKHVMPIFIDLNKVYHFADSLANSSFLSEKERGPLQNELLEYYIRVMIYRGFLECLRNRNLDNKLLDFLKTLLGIDFSKKQKISEIRGFLEKEIIYLGAPFSAQDLIAGKLTLAPNISYREEIQKLLTNPYSEIFDKIYRALGTRTFIIILDEFSMLPARLQDAMMGNVIQSLESKREYTVYYKIAVMSGRYLIDTQTKDMYQHGFLPMRFEREYFDIFKGADPETSIDKYYEALCLNRLRGMAGHFLNEKGSSMEDGMQVENLFTDSNGTNCFKMLVNFAGYNFRRFLTFIANICKEKPEAHCFTEEMILQQSNSHYIEMIGKIKENPELQQYAQCVDSFLTELVELLPQDTLYFALSDDQPFIIRALEYFSIITQVTDKVKENRKIPVYLLDLSTYVASKKYGLKDVHEKFAKGQLAIFRIGNIDKVPVFNTDDLKGIQLATKMDEKYQELARYYQDILDLESDLTAGEDKTYVSKSIDRIFRKIEQKFKEKHTKDSLENKLKSFESRFENVLKADKFLKNDLKKEDQIQKTLQATLGAAAIKGYDQDKEMAKLSKRANMDNRLLEELVKIKVTDDFLASIKGNQTKIDGLANLLPTEVRSSLIKILST